MKIIITCEHGGNAVPVRFRELFRGSGRLLNSHRGYDKNALSIAKDLARKLDAPLFFSTVTRLLIDLNRSLHHPKLFSDRTGELRPDEQRRIVEEHYFPYREKVKSAITACLSKGVPVLHISVHSFAPVMRGTAKKADIGILYDPARVREKRVSVRWQKALVKTMPGLRVRRNYPYRGVADGLITSFRKKFPPEHYIGIELELNQRLLKRYINRPDLPVSALVSGLVSATLACKR